MLDLVIIPQFLKIQFCWSEKQIAHFYSLHRSAICLEFRQARDLYITIQTIRKQRRGCTSETIERHYAGLGKDRMQVI